MAMAWVWSGMVVCSLVFGILNGRLEQVSAAAMEGAGAAIQLCLSMAGVMCLWTGIMEIMNRCGMTEGLSRLFRPVVRRLMPEAARDPETLAALSANISANLLGLGNAATPLGLAAVKEMAAKNTRQPTNGLMLFVVLNTASLQLIPTYAINLRSQYNCADPYDILPCIWLVSAISLLVCLGASKFFSLGRSYV